MSDNIKNSTLSTQSKEKSLNPAILKKIENYKRVTSKLKDILSII